MFILIDTIGDLKVINDRGVSLPSNKNSCLIYFLSALYFLSIGLIYQLAVCPKENNSKPKQSKSIKH